MGKNIAFVGHGPMPMEAAGFLTETVSERRLSLGKHFEAACETLDAVYRLTGKWNLAVDITVPDQTSPSGIAEPQRASQVAGTGERGACGEIHEVVERAINFSNLAMRDAPQFADTALMGLRKLAAQLRYHIPTHPALSSLDEYIVAHAHEIERKSLISE